MKKILALMLVLVMLAATFAACGGTETTSTPAESTPAESTPAEEAAATEIPLDTLIVGTPEMNGDFIVDFGNSAYDLSIKTLLGGYMDTVVADANGTLIINPTVVADYTTETDDAGNKTYTFTLHEDLFFSNGDPIMASDYAANYLFRASPEWVTAGATSSLGDGLLGYTEYYNGETTTFVGVKVLGDYQLALTIPAEKLPYYWETYYAAATPIHTATYMPGATVMSDETGSWLEWAEGDLATATLAIAETERFAPTVTVGPYKFVSYENQTATLEMNEFFKGDHMGNKPTFQYVVQQSIPQDTDVEWVINGQVDMVTGVIEGEKIEAARASDTAVLHSYLRAGYGNMAMHTDFGPTADVNVRWALASLIDRNAVVDHVLGGYGGLVDAAYAYAQWMYDEKAAELQETLIPISYNIEAANEYLDQTEWTFEADGTTPFDATLAVEGSEYFRHNAAGDMLVIEHLGTTENTVTDIIEIQFTANAPLAGVKFNVTKSDFDALLNNYYYGFELGEERQYHTFNLATNFTAVDDKYYNWHSDFAGTWQNSTQLVDEELDATMIAMRNADPSDTETYLNAWFDFIVRWNELMPEIPLYSNEYFDITHKNVDPLMTTPYGSWYEVICQITKTAK